MSDCRKCTNAETCYVEEDCGLFAEKPVTTNYDRLISKTPEELSDFLVEHDFTVHGMLAKKKLILDLLKSPVERGQTMTK